MRITRRRSRPSVAIEIAGVAAHLFKSGSGLGARHAAMAGGTRRAHVGMLALSFPMRKTGRFDVGQPELAPGLSVQSLVRSRIEISPYWYCVDLRYRYLCCLRHCLHRKFRGFC